LDRLSNQCLHNLTVNPTVQPTVESTVGPTVQPTVRSILKPCKCAITLVGKLPLITGKTAWNWRRAVLSADAGLLVNSRCNVCNHGLFQKNMLNSIIYRMNVDAHISRIFIGIQCSSPLKNVSSHKALKLADTLRGSRPGVQSASLIMTS